MAPPSFDDLETARLEFIQFRGALSDIHSMYDGRWLPNSQANSERASFVSPEDASAALCQGAVLIQVAADQLMAFTKTLTNPVQAIAPWACIRTMLETSALSSWLLDPQLDIRTRVQRSLAWQFEGLEQQLKYVRTSGLHDKATVTLIERHIDELENTALQLGYQRQVDKNRRRVRVGQRMPSSTEIVKQVYGNESSYRLTSAFVHGHFWAMQQLSFRADSAVSRTPVLDEQQGIVHVVNDVSPSNLILLIEIAGMIFARPIWNHCCLYGWDLIRMRKILDGWADTRSVSPHSRFWKADRAC
jgi:hypothetical protein